MGRRAILPVLIAALLASPAHAQLLPFLRPKPPPAPVEALPPPPPDPKAWWEDKEPDQDLAKDPLGQRRATRAEASSARDVNNGVGPLLYRLWGLPPLQIQLVREGEAVVEIWVRPSGSVRQAVVRITVRRDGRAFVQARAGLGCCRPEILRRVDVDQELPAGSAEPLLALVKDPAWAAPEDVIQRQKGVGVLESVCVNGVAYDLTLMTAGSLRHLRRSCDSEAIGQTAGILSAVIGAALGKEPRFDFLFPKGADFSSDAEAYSSFTAAGGALAAAPKR